MPDQVTICECFARDGLQHETGFVATQTKLDLLASFVDVGFRRIEATSYSHPDRVPAFRDASAVLAGVRRRPGVAYKATCPNPRAVERAIADLDAGHGADELSFLVSATEAHTERNLHTTRERQWQNVKQMAALAAGRFRIVGVVSVALGCPFEGAVDPGVVVEDVRRFADVGAELVTIGDTTGQGTPRSVAQLFSLLDQADTGVTPVAHFHNTRGSGVANAVAALEAGCRNFDSSIGGVGGHPAEIHYGGGMTGNISTEDLAFLLDGMGVETGLDMDALMRSSAQCEAALGRKTQSMMARVVEATRD